MKGAGGGMLLGYAKAPATGAVAGAFLSAAGISPCGC